MIGRCLLAITLAVATWGLPLLPALGSQTETVVDFNSGSQDALANAGIVLTQGSFLTESVAGSNLVMPPGLNRVGFLLGPEASANPQLMHCAQLSFTAPGGLSALTLP